jgi:dTDP-4-dehydrorhamnose 3,5-epimerase-like enzyme
MLMALCIDIFYFRDICRCRSSVTIRAVCEESLKMHRDRRGVAARSGQATEAAVQAAEIDCPALG